MLDSMSKIGWFFENLAFGKRVLWKKGVQEGLMPSVFGQRPELLSAFFFFSDNLL